VALLPDDASQALPVVILTVSPSRDAEGRKAYSKRGQLFDAMVDGQVIVERSTTPFCDAARRLVDLGHDGNATLVMKHAGSDVVALKGRLSIAAGLSVTEKDGPPKFRRWEPHVRGTPSTGFSEAPVPYQPPSQERIHDAPAACPEAILATEDEAG
jgi:hypothetical protein